MGGGSRVAMMVAPIFVVAVLVGSMQSAEAASYTVGGDIGWTNALPNSTFYSDWASSITFLVDDTLVFNFGSTHDVAQVSQEAYESCDTSSTPTSSSSPATVKLTASSYFICTKGTHCSQGQKLAVTVSNSPSTSTPPTSDTNSTTTSSPPPPPPTNSASSPATAAATAAACVVFGVGLLI